MRKGTVCMHALGIVLFVHVVVACNVPLQLQYASVFMWLKLHWSATSTLITTL